MVKKTVQEAKKTDYKNFQIILIDSTTDQEIQTKTLEIAKNQGIKYIHRKTLRGYKAGSINDVIKNLSVKFKYILILDSDHKLKKQILQDLIPILEENPTLSFIQTPQYFQTEKNDRLGLAYSFQQHIYYKHICRGLSINKTAYICGTNVIIRLSHLKEIGGMDETCITEDISTSFIFHTKGYESIYLDQVYAEGMYPPSLSAYYGQQLRWSYGTIQNTKKVLYNLLTNPKSLNAIQWFEYLVLNGTWYFIGLAILIWLIYPALVLLLNLEPLIIAPINLPFYIFIIMIGAQTITSFKERDFPIKDLLLTQALFLSLFPVYIKAFLYGILNKKLEFKVTPKKDVNKTPFLAILPQLMIFILLIISIIVGLFKLNSIENVQKYSSIIFWAFYSLFMLSLFILYFFFEDKKKYKDYQTS
jgi:cellulose synthase (UDP-forming)